MPLKVKGHLNRPTLDDLALSVDEQMNTMQQSCLCFCICKDVALKLAHIINIKSAWICTEDALLKELYTSVADRVLRQVLSLAGVSCNGILVLGVCNTSEPIFCQPVADPRYAWGQSLKHRSMEKHCVLQGIAGAGQMA
jgi:hypothetical protein